MTHVLEGGETLTNTHSAENCVGDRCTIHKMTDHPLRHLPQHWNGAYMERIEVTEYEVLIWPDPDDIHCPERPNAIICNQCHEVLYSRRRHDWVQCSGGHVFADGGTAYHRRGFDDPSHMIEIEEWPVGLPITKPLRKRKTDA